MGEEVWHGAPEGRGGEVDESVMGYHDHPLLSYWGCDHMGLVVTLLSSCQPV